MTVHGMNHFTVLAADLDKTTEFYTSLLGLKPGHRPPLGFPGAWLYSGNQAVLHIVAGRGMPEKPAGVLDHMAFSAKGLEKTLAALDSRGVPYTVGRQVENRIWQVFFHDPNGAKIELDFSPEEKGPER